MLFLTDMMAHAVLSTFWKEWTAALRTLGIMYLFHGGHGEDKIDLAPSRRNCVGLETFSPLQACSESRLPYEIVTLLMSSWLYRIQQKTEFVPVHAPKHLAGNPRTVAAIVRSGGGASHVGRDSVGQGRLS
jgi:hypothetical protein